MKKVEQNSSFEDINALVLRNSVWGLFGQQVKPFKVFFLLAFLGVLITVVSFITLNTALLPAGFFIISTAGPLAFMAFINKKTQCLNSLVPGMILTCFFVGGTVALMVGGALNTVMMKLDPAYIALVKAKHNVEAPSAGMRKVEQKAVDGKQDICAKVESNLTTPEKKDNTKVAKLILLVGFFEEAAKLIFPLLMLLLVPLARRNVSIGLAMGALTALGFAVLESLYYGLANFPAFSDLGFMLLNCSATLLAVIGKIDIVLVFRDLTTPFGHLAWTGTASIIIWHLIRSNKSTFAKVVLSIGIYLVVAVLHSLNDFFLLNMGNINYSKLMQAGEVMVIITSFSLLYFSMRLAIFQDKPASIQVWEKLNLE